MQGTDPPAGSLVAPGSNVVVYVGIVCDPNSTADADADDDRVYDAWNVSDSSSAPWSSTFTTPVSGGTIL